MTTTLKNTASFKMLINELIDNLLLPNKYLHSSAKIRDALKENDYMVVESELISVLAELIEESKLVRRNMEETYINPEDIEKHKESLSGIKERISGLKLNKMEANRQLEQKNTLLASMG